MIKHLQLFYKGLLLLTFLIFSQTQLFAQSKAQSHSGSITLPVGSSIQGLPKWSSGSTWEGGVKPGNDAEVIIPMNAVVVLDQNINVKSIRVMGKLIVDITKNITVSTEYIMVMGANAYFEWGTENELYNKLGVITLVGNDPTKKIPGTNVESKAFMIMEGATVELHAANKTSWTTLSSNAAANQNKINITDKNSNWKVGDEIVIAPSRLSWNEGEKKTITAISNGVITLNSNLKYPHIGEVKSYTRKDGKTWEGDMRAEVGLLTKSIKIQGDASSDGSQFGGHIMVHHEGYAHIENIELYRMGQATILGRYPFHWHMVAENGAGQYFKNSSIHRTYNRALTIHGTESTLVENNFCYDHLGHGLFLEDGSERFNVIRNNVLLLTKRPAAGKEVIPSDNEMNEVQNRTPASYWITNPNNTFENNVAAGTQGTGFWFIMPKKPVGPSANHPRFKDLEPYKEKLGKFEGNKAHSCKSGFDIFDQLKGNHGIARNAAWQRTDRREMKNCTWYANDLAVYGGIGGGRAYTQNVVFYDNVFLDNMTSVMHANYATMEQSVFVANSGENVFNGERKLNRGYDGACTIKDCHLVGWDASNANYVQNTGGANKHTNYRISGLTLSPDKSVRMSFPSYAGIPKGGVGANASAHPRFWSYVHWDIDGTLSGKPNTSIVTNHPLCRDGSEVRYANWNNLFRTDRRFAYMTARGGGNPKMTIVRTKSGTPKAGQYYVNDDGAGFYGQFIQFPVIVNDGFLYTLQFEKLSTDKKVTLRMVNAYTSGDEVLYRIKDFGRLGGVSVSNASKKTTLDAVKSTGSSAWAIVGNDVYLKMRVGNNPDISCAVSWSTNVTLPKLDTDGDGKSDYDESVAGTDPVGNDPIPTAKIIEWVPATTVNNKPIASFEAPTFSTIEEGYADLYVKVQASDPDNDAISLMLKIDGVEIRKEGAAPYEWGQVSSNPLTDIETQNLSAGDHLFEVVVTDSKGASTTISKTITVTRVNQNPEIEITSPAEGAVFTVGDEIVIRADATDDVAVTKVNFKLNGGYYKQDLTPTGIEYSTTFTPTEEGFYALGARAFDDEGGAIEVVVNIEVKKDITTGTGVDMDSELSIYPNPTTGMINLGRKTEWELYSTLGIRVLEGRGEEVDLSNEQQGMFILKIEGKMISVIHQ